MPVSDNFEAPDTNWGPADAYSVVHNGTFEFHVPAKQQSERYYSKYAAPEVDMQVEVDALAAPGTTLSLASFFTPGTPVPETGAPAAVGLIFCADGTGNAETLFLIDPNQGRSAIFSKTGGKLTPIYSWAPDTSVHVGIGKSNRIEVVVGAKYISYRVNGTPDGETPTPPQSPGSHIGLYAAGGDNVSADYAFSSFLARSVSPSMEPIGQTTGMDIWNEVNSKPPDMPVVRTATGAKLPIGIGPGQTLFTDDFKTLDPDWGTADTYSFVQGGRYELHAPVNEEIDRFSNKYAVTNVDFGVDVVAEPETKDATVGLSFWADGTGNTETVFEIDPPQGTFSIQSETANKWTIIQDWRSTPLLNVGAGNTNHLEVVAADKKTLFLINGHQAGEMPTPSSFPGSLIGFNGSGNDTSPGYFGFSNFAAKVPVDSDLPPGTVAAPSAAPGQSIFSDDFKSLDPSWGVANAANQVEGGRLELHAAANDDSSLINNKYAYQEADIATAVVEETGAPSDAVAGLLFWSADADDYILFAVDPANGTFAALREDANKSTTLADWQYTSAVNVGIGKSNRIGVALRKDKALLLINGQQVAEIPAPARPPGSLIGVYSSAGVKNPATFDFSDFTVTQPAGEGSPPGTTPAPPPTPVTAIQAPGGAPGQIIFSDDFTTLDSSWGQATDLSFVKDGRLELHSRAGREIDELNGKYTYQLADIAVDAVAEAGTAGQGSAAGLLFWAADAENYTVFDIDPVTSNFAVFRDQGGKSTTLIDWRPTTLLNVGVGTTNRLGLGLSADKVVLMINGHQVGEIPAPSSPAGGLIGLYSGGGNNAPGNFGFTDLSVAVPASASFPPGTVAAPATSSGQIIYADDFNAFDPSWGVSGAASYVQNGRLELRSLPSQEIDLINNKYAYNDADVSASVIEESGSGSGPLAGVLFWAADAYDYTLFGVDPLSGKFAVFQEADDQTTTLVNWTPSPALARGLGKSNQIGVVLQGAQALLTINGQKVGQIAMPPVIPGSLIGLYGGGDKDPGSFGYSNFVVKAPAAGGAINTGAEIQPSTVPQSVPASPAQSAPPVQAALAPQPEGQRVSQPSQTTSSPASAPPQSATSSMCAGRVVFADNFERMDPAWGKPDQTAFVTPNHAFGLGAYTGRLNGRINFTSRYADVDVCVESFISETHGPDDIGGLAFWVDDVRNYYILIITGDGRFGVRRYQAGTFTSLPVPITVTSALKTGTNVPNALEVSMAGNQATIIINGQRVGSFTGEPPPKGGYIGLEVGAAQTGVTVWGFYHLVVASPSSVATPAATASAGLGQCSGQTLYADNFQSFDPSWGTPDQLGFVQNGMLNLAAAAGQTTSRVNTKSRYGDFDICVAVGTPLDPNVAGSAGLIFWANDPQNFYILATTAGGWYAVLRYAAGQVSAPVPWTSTDALRPGAKIWNELEVSATGNMASVAINGRQVTTIQGSPPPDKSYVALIVAAPQKARTAWAFSRLKIAAPAIPAAALNVPAPRP